MSGSQHIMVHVGGLTCGAEDLVVYLASNRAALRREGFGLYCFDVNGAGGDTMGDIMPPPGASPRDLDEAGAVLARRFAPDRKAAELGFVISATELAGPLPELLLGRFHPQIRARASVLRRAIGQRVNRLVMVVQPYEELLHTCWMMMALDRKIDPFTYYAQAVWQFRSGWADMAEALCEELEVEELVVRAAPFAPAELVRALLPGVPLRPIVDPLPKPRITPSAVAMVQRCMSQGMRLQSGQRDRLVAFHARQPQIPADYGFGLRERDNLRARYLDDIARMQARLGAVVEGLPEPVAA